MTSELRRLEERFDETNGLLRTLVGLHSFAKKLELIVAEHADGAGGSLDPTDMAGAHFVLGLVALARRLEAVTNVHPTAVDRLRASAPAASLWR